MSSELASQLQILSSARGSGGPQTRIQTFLYFGENAGNRITDIELIKDQSLNGLLDLANTHDASLLKYRSLLDAPDKSAQSDKLLDEFMLSLTPYVMLKSCHKILEFLVRYYTVNLRKVNSVMQMILPYHQTWVFTRMCQICNIKNNPMWMFLFHSTRTGSALSRHVLVHECIKNYGLVSYLAETNELYATVSSNSSSLLSAQKIYITFYTVTIIECLSRSEHKITDKLLHIMLPFVMNGLRKKKSVVVQYCYYMITTALSRKVGFSTEVLESIMTCIVKNLPNSSGGNQVGDKEMHHALLLLIGLFSTQDLFEFPKKAFMMIVRYNNLVSILKSIVEEEGYDITHFMKHFIISLAKFYQKHENYQEVLVQAVKNLPLTENIVSILLEELFEQHINTITLAAEEDKDNNSSSNREGIRSGLRRIIITIEEKYPLTTRNTINNLLSYKSKDESSYNIFINTLQHSLRGTASQLSSDCSQTLLSTLSHESLQVRLLSIAQIDAMMCKSKATPLFLSQCETALLYVLNHEEEGKVLSSLMSMRIMKTSVSLQKAMLPYVMNLLKRLLSLTGKAIESALNACLLFIINIIDFEELIVYHANLFSCVLYVIESIKSKKLISSCYMIIKLLGECKRESEVQKFCLQLGKNKDVKDIYNMIMNDRISELDVKILRLSSEVLLYQNKGFDVNVLCQCMFKEQICTSIWMKMLISSIQNAKIEHAINVLYIIVESIKDQNNNQENNNQQLLKELIYYLPSWNTVSDSKDNQIHDKYQQLLYNICLYSPIVINDILNCQIFDTHQDKMQFIMYFLVSNDTTNNHILCTVMSLRNITEWCKKSIELFDDFCLFAELNTTSTDISHTFPLAVYSCLGKTSKTIRHAAIMTIESILSNIINVSKSKSIYNLSFQSLFKTVYNHREGVLESSVYYNNLIDNISDDNKQNIFNYIINDVYMLLHDHVKNNIFLVNYLQLALSMKCYDSTNICESMIETILSSSAASNKNYSVDICVFLFRIVFNNQKSFKLLIKVLDSKITATKDNDNITLTYLLLSQRNELILLFSRLNNEERQTFLHKLLDIAEMDNNTTSTQAVLCIEALPFLPSLFLSSLSVHKLRKARVTLQILLKKLQEKHNHDDMNDDDNGFHNNDITIFTLPLFKMINWLNVESSLSYSECCYLRQLSIKCIAILSDHIKHYNITIDKKQILLKPLVKCIISDIDNDNDDNNEIATKMRSEALLLLAELASIVPKELIEHVLPVFSFLSNNKDDILFGQDAFQFGQIIQVIDTLLPPLNNMGLDRYNIILLFLNSINRMGEQQRVPLFITLINAISTEKDKDTTVVPSKKDDLSPLAQVMIICARMDTHNDNDDNVNMMSFCRELISSFHSIVQLQALCQLSLLCVGDNENNDDNTKIEIFLFIKQQCKSMKFLESLLSLNEEEEDIAQEVMAQIFLSLFTFTHYKTTQILPNVEKQSKKAYEAVSELISIEHFCICIIELLKCSSIESRYMSNVGKVALSFFNDRILMFVNSINNHDNDNNDDNDDNVNTDLQDMSCFVDITETLADYLTQSLRYSLTKRIHTTHVNHTNITATINDKIAYEQMLLLSMDTLASAFSHITVFSDIFLKLVNNILIALDNNVNQSSAVKSSALVALSSVISGLGVHFLPQLSKTVPLCLSCLEESLNNNDNNDNNNDNDNDIKTSKSRKRMRTTDNNNESTLESSNYMCLSALTCVESFLSCIANMMSPYLSRIIILLHHPTLATATVGGGDADMNNNEDGDEDYIVVKRNINNNNDHDKDKSISLLLKRIFEFLKNIPHRILYPILFESFKRICSFKNPYCLIQYFSIMEALVEKRSQQVTEFNANHIYKFYLIAFDMRMIMKPNNNKKQHLYKFDQVEDACIQSFVALLLKLNEEKFRAFFLKLIEWCGLKRLISIALMKSANNNEQNNNNNNQQIFEEENHLLHRCLLFFRFVHYVTNKLKILFTPYYSYLVQYMLLFLTSSSSNSNNDQQHSLHLLRCKICEYICLSLSESFKYDSQDSLSNNETQFWTQEHYQLLIQPLLSQISIFEEITSQKEYLYFILNTFMPCIISMATSMRSPDYWKPLHSGILSYFRDENATIRYSAVLIVTTLFKECKHDYLGLLPETIPFIAEVMEDENEAVELQTQKLISEIESLSGEDLQDYL